MNSQFHDSVEKVVKALARAGVEAGDTLFVHSSLRSLGPVERSNVPTLCETLLSGLLDLLGETGTLLVPAYFYEYARHGEPFDVIRSPVSKELGVFSAYVAHRDQAIRSKNPTTSMAGIGAKADLICGQGTPTAYGHGSPWGRLTEAGAKIVGIGTRFNTMTYVHYIEQVYGVPHMYHKYFQTPVYEDGKRLDVNVINYVRYLRYGIKAEMLKFEADLRKRELVRFKRTDHSHVYVADCETLLREGLAKLQVDPFYFLEKKPEFVAGEIPLA